MMRTSSGSQKQWRTVFRIWPLLYYCSVYGCYLASSRLVFALVVAPRIRHENPFHSASLSLLVSQVRPLRSDRKPAFRFLATRSDEDDNLQKLDLHENATIPELESHSETRHHQRVSSNPNSYSSHDKEALEDDALHKTAAPLTLSDPAFDLGVGQHEKTMTERKPNSTTTKKTVSKSFTFPSSLLGTKEFFSTNQIKLLPEISVAFPSKNDSTMVVPVLDMTSILMPNNVTSMLLPDLANSISKVGMVGMDVNKNNNASTASYSNNATSLYDPLSFWNEQTNYTRQQMDRFWDYSVNASRQLEDAQKALLGSYKAMGIMPKSPSPYTIGGGNNNNNNRNKILSIEELDAYLRLNGYVKQEDLGKAGSGSGNSGMPQEAPISMGLPISQFGRGRGKALRGRKDNSGFQAVGNVSPTKSILGDGVAFSSAVSTQTNGGATGRVAFPQPSILSYSKLKWGSAVAASFLGLIGSITISANLWLLGAIFGGLYGYETTKNLAERPPSNALSNLIVYMGRELTKIYLKIFDFGSGIWFMYKTGQLSYEYWQKYAALDQQFAIQSKIDAWNARFLKGKENFDRWEQENEVGRKLLASLRTMWLVEENAFRKSARRKKSRYRVVQWFYDGSRYVRKKVHKIYSERGQFWKGIQELAEGMRQELADPSQWQLRIRPRIVAALAALTFVNLTGTLFSVSPALLGFVAAVLGGIVWPTWFSDWLGRIGTFFEETKAKGRGEELGQLIRNTLPGPGAKSNSMVPIRRQGPTYSQPKKTVSWTPFGKKKDKELYSFYRRSDGSKRWYRAGRSPWDVKSSLSNLFGEQKQEDGKPRWSIKN